MFNIKQMGFRPGGIDEVKLEVFVQGMVMTINGEEFDFSFMEKESELPRDYIGSEHFGSDAVCDAQGTVNVTIKVPYGPAATDDEIYPPDLIGKKYGKVIDILIPPLTLPELPVPDKTTPEEGAEDAN